MFERVWVSVKRDVRDGGELMLPIDSTQLRCPAVWLVSIGSASRRSALSVMVLWLCCCLVPFVRRIRARTAGLTVFVSLLWSRVQCNAMTIDNALLGQNMVISMDSATKHFILTFYEMKNLENN